jgi:NADPH2:quinone reductase
MRAVQIARQGGPDVLQLVDIPKPEPDEGEVRLRIEAAGVNFIDMYHRSGQYELELPFTPGVEGAGVVDAVGSGGSEFGVGDRVAYVMQPGAYAQYAIVPAMKLVPIPEDVDTTTAAAVMLQGMTAHYLSYATYPVEEGDLVLIQAAAGGVGGLLVQLAKARGGTVFGTASTEEKIRVAKEAGADHVMQYTEVDFADEVDRLTDGKGVDVVYDSVGKTTFWKSLNCLRPRGYMVLFGQSSGPVEPIDPQELRKHGSLYLTRPSLAHYVAEREELLERASAVFDMVAAGELEVRIDRTLALEEAADAHAYVEGRKTKGKVILVTG